MAAYYMALLLYPLLSARILQTFVCQTVEGETFVRADMSIRCYTDKWWGAATYAGIWTALYVLGFPVAFCLFLKANKHKILEEHWNEPGIDAADREQRLHEHDKFEQHFGYLYRDFKPDFYDTIQTFR